MPAPHRQIWYALFSGQTFKKGDGLPVRIFWFILILLPAFVLAESASFAVSVKNKQDQASVCFKADRLEVTVSSQRGIGNLRLMRKDAPEWPKHIQLLIDVQELEGLTLRMGTQTLDVSRRLPGPLTIALRGSSVQIDIPRASLPETSASFMDIQWVDFYR